MTCFVRQKKIALIDKSELLTYTRNQIHRHIYTGLQLMLKTTNFRELMKLGNKSGRGKCEREREVIVVWSIIQC